MRLFQFTLANGTVKRAYGKSANQAWLSLGYSETQLNLIDKWETL